MRTAHAPAIPGSIAFGELDGLTLAPDHRRLLACATFSALLLAVAIATINVSLELDFSRLIPVMLEVTLRDEARPEPVPDSRVAEPPESAVEEAPATVVEEPVRVPADEPRPEVAAPTEGAPPVDWYAELERASAETVDEQSAIDSLHPEFDELRRIAKERYAPPQTHKPPPIWENVEQDIYGRTLLRQGNCFQVLDDTNAGNQYAFETFERHLWQCEFSFGRKRGENLPWVETIRAKYNHLRDPDGSQSTPAATRTATGD